MKTKQYARPKFKNIKGVAHLYKELNSGRYYARIYVVEGGRSVQRTIALKTDDRTVAQRELRRLEQVRVRSKAVHGDDIDADMTVGMAVVILREKFGFRRPYGGRMPLVEVPSDMKESSTLAHENEIRAMRNDFSAIGVEIESKRLVDVTHDLLLKWWAYMRQDKKEGTINSRLATLRRVFDVGVVRGVLDSNPMAPFKTLRIPKRERFTPSREQFEEFLINLAGHCEPLTVNAVRCMAATGLRISEFTGIRWKDVNFDDRTITLRGGHEGLKGRKPGESRTMPLTSYGIEAFAILRDADQMYLADGDGERRCFPRGEWKTINSKQRWVPGEVNDGMRGASRRLGFLPGFTGAHGLRRYFITRCLADGMSKEMLAHIVDHRDLGETIRKSYDQVSLADERRAIEEMERRKNGSE